MAIWLETFTANLSPTTVSRYEQLIDNYMLNQLNPLVVQSWVNSLKISPVSQKELSATSIKHAYHVLKGAFERATTSGLISRSPCVGITLPKGQKKAAVIYDEEQLKQLLKAAKGTEMELIVDIELSMGLRRGELLGLQWGDISWEKKQVHIKRSRVVVKGKSTIKEPKTAAGIRVIDMPDQLVQKLKLHQWKCMENKKKFGKMYNDSDFVIVYEDGTLPYPENISQRWKRLLESAGLGQSKARFHDLRHMAASIMLRQGVPMKNAKEILGHADISTTMNIYTHVLPSSAREAAEKIGSFVFESA